MIQIEQIEISEFRGIRHLILALGRKSFGIAGPNGTGKSGIVDAAEFGLTGNITRLGGEGTADLSVKAHAPHVDSQKKPEKAVVKITGYAPSLGNALPSNEASKRPRRRLSLRTIQKRGNLSRSWKRIPNLRSPGGKSLNTFLRPQGSDRRMYRPCCGSNKSRRFEHRSYE
jgi:hypothetical protein